jgi:predicted dehydrogenase
MIRVGLIGCGTIADQHIAAIRRIPGCAVVGVCDSDDLMAKQLAERFHVERTYTNAADLLQQAHPDVVHITTPPQSHFSLGKRCLESGVNVLMEKPFTLNADEAIELLELAETRRLKVTVGHVLQFRTEAERMRELVSGGFLGGPPLHMDSVQCFGHADPVYGKTVLGDRSHWVRSLPGSLLHNLISHGIAKIAEFLPCERPTVVAFPFTSPYLKDLGHNDIVDEIRAIIHTGGTPTAQYTFSTQFSIGANQFRLYGRTGGLIVDNMNRTIVRLEPTSYKSYLRYFFEPRRLAREYIRNSWSNIGRFLRRDFHEGNCMKRLIELFYRSIEAGTDVPIPYSEIVTTARIMDAIFAQLPRMHSAYSTRDSHQIPERV